MLVLSRKQNETIVINDEVTIEILQIKGNQIRIGIVAPREVRVRRGELTPWSQTQTEWSLPVATTKEHPVAPKLPAGSPLADKLRAGKAAVSVAGTGNLVREEVASLLVANAS